MGNVREDMKKFNLLSESNNDITIDEDFYDKINNLVAFITYAKDLEFDKKIIEIINKEIVQMVNKIRNTDELITFMVGLYNRDGLTELDMCLPEALKQINRTFAPERYKSGLEKKWNDFKRLSVTEMIDYLECQSNWAYTQTSKGDIVGNLSGQEYEDEFGYFQDEEDVKYHYNMLNSNQLYMALCEANEVIEKYQDKSETTK